MAEYKPKSLRHGKMSIYNLLSSWEVKSNQPIFVIGLMTSWLFFVAIFFFFFCNFFPHIWSFSRFLNQTSSVPFTSDPASLVNHALGGPTIQVQTCLGGQIITNQFTELNFREYKLVFAARTLTWKLKQWGLMSHNIDLEMLRSALILWQKIKQRKSGRKLSYETLTSK